jgi:trans-aconitate 2-methyltransferase
VTQRTWDAGTYDRVSNVQEAWARTVLDRLTLRGDETVLDAGCGSGRVTELLLERLPDGHVIGVDASEDMIDRARGRLGDRATLIVADLTELELQRPVDAVFSNAVFHWVLDHERLFERMLTALAPGGPLVAQCGGEGNIRRLLSLVDEVAARELFDQHLQGFSRTWSFPNAEDTADRLRAAGFTHVSTWLEPSDVTPDEPEAYLRAVVLGVHLDRLPEELHDGFVHQVMARAGEPMVFDYVRLNIDARRPE